MNTVLTSFFVFQLLLFMSLNAMEEILKQKKDHAIQQTEIPNLQKLCTERLLTGKCPLSRSQLLSPDLLETFKKQFTRKHLLNLVRHDALLTKKRMQHYINTVSVAFSFDDDELLTVTQSLQSQLFLYKTFMKKQPYLDTTEAMKMTAYCITALNPICGQWDAGTGIWNRCVAPIIATIIPAQKPEKKYLPLVFFDLSGTHALTCHNNRYVRLWNFGKEPIDFIDLDGHEKKVTAFAVSPCHRYAATGSKDNNIRLWDLQPLLLSYPENYVDMQEL